MPGFDRAALLSAAERAFARHGYTGATLERIAEEAGLSRVTLHRRGITKDGLLGELVERGTAAYQRAMWPALTASEPARDRLATGLRALCGAAEDHLALLVALRSRSDAVFHDDGDAALTRSVFTEPLERLLRDGAADGSLRPLDPAVTATVLFNVVAWSYVHLRTGHGWAPEDARDAVIDLALNGVVAS